MKKRTLPLLLAIVFMFASCSKPETTPESSAESSDVSVILSSSATEESSQEQVEWVSIDTVPGILFEVPIDCTIEVLNGNTYVTFPNGNNNVLIIMPSVDVGISNFDTAQMNTMVEQTIESLGGESNVRNSSSYNSGNFWVREIEAELIKDGSVVQTIIFYILHPMDAETEMYVFMYSTTPDDIRVNWQTVTKILKTVISAE